MRPPADPANLLTPFWRSDTIVGESILLLPDENGHAAAQLMFSPDAVLSIVNAAGDTAYAEGRDYSVDRVRGRIIRTADSRMPVFAEHVLTARGGSLLTGEVSDVTYTHRDRWTGVVPEFAGDRLVRTSERLRNREPLTICLCGDSISEGYDGSGFHGLPPGQPAFGSLVADALERHYGLPIDFRNLATAGWTAAEGVYDTDRVVAQNPDLVVVAYGMNDAAYAEAGEFVRNVSGIVDRIRESVPHAEFVVVSPMLPTTACDWVVPRRFAEYRTGLAGVAGQGIALADVTGMWTDIVARKGPWALSGNGLNHTNDFGHRVYAQVILALLVQNP